jgi:hypothetical protein
VIGIAPKVITKYAKVKHLKRLNLASAKPSIVEHIKAAKNKNPIPNLITVLGSIFFAIASHKTPLLD